MTRSGIIAVGSGLLVLLLAIFLGQRLYGTDPVPVRAIVPTRADVDLTVITTGKVFPKNDFQARANFSGMVELVAVQLGDHVSPGQLLIKMKDPFARQRVIAAKAALQATEVTSQNVHQGGSQDELIGMAADRTRALQEQQSASGGLAAIKQLAERGAASQAEVAAATQRLDTANTILKTINARHEHRFSDADVASWTSRVADARESLEAQKATFANANITSPIGGTAYLVPIRAYDFVSAGADLLHIADLSQVEVRAYFDEPDIGKLHNGQSVTITWEGRPGEAWHGHISRSPLAAMASGSRNVGDCAIAVDDAKGGLLPNTNVTVTVSIDKHPNVLTIPRQSLHMEGNNAFVYRIDSGILRKTPVQVGLMNLTYAEILRGVGPDDRIAVTPGDNGDLKDHLRVSPTS